jgi:hypothetical protein
VNGAAAPSSAASTDPLEQIRKLAELRDAGAITPEEFEERKRSFSAGFESYGLGLQEVAVAATARRWSTLRGLTGIAVLRQVSLP